MIEINGQPIQPDSGVQVDGGEVYMLPRGSLQFRTYSGWTMDPLYLPPPEKVWQTFVTLHQIRDFAWSSFLVLQGND